MKNESFFKTETVKGTVTGVISTLIIMWFIEPFTDWIFPKIMKATEYFSTSFSDYIYRSSAHMTNETTGTLILVFVFLQIYVLFLCFFIFSRLLLRFSLGDFTEDEGSDENGKDTSRKRSFFTPQFKQTFYKISSTLFLVFLLMFSFITMTQIYRSNISASTHANIEIVSPYISDQEYKQLKSDFYTIDGKQDYDALYKTLHDIAEKHSLNLKE